MCCPYFSRGCKIRTICVCVCVCDEIILMTVFFLYGDGLPKGLRVCDVCGDTVMVRRFLCTVGNNADSFRDIYLYALYTFIYALFICICYPSIYGATAPSGPWPSLEDASILLYSTRSQTHTHTHTHTHIVHISTHTHTHTHTYRQTRL